MYRQRGEPGLFAFIVRRLLLAVPIMVGVSFVTFVCFRIIPGDIADIRCGITGDEECRQEIRERFGLDDPWYEQYWDWLTGVLQGDLGTSMGEGELAVTTELERRLPVTIELMVLTVLLTLAIGVPLGILSAARAGTAYDSGAKLVAVIGLSVPGFYLGVLAISFGAAWFGWSPPQFATGYVAPLEDPWVNFQQFFLPALVLALGSAAVTMRLLRSSMLEVLRQDYIRTAYSKGLQERSVIWRHTVKNAFIPVVTIVGLEIGGLIGGAVIIESIFALNGIGAYLLYSIGTRDFIVVQSLVFLIALFYVVVNLVVDVLYAWLDPRIRYV
jgi:peptide/nickel transport system permease protein